MLHLDGHRAEDGSPRTWTIPLQGRVRNRPKPVRVKRSRRRC